MSRSSRDCDVTRASALTPCAVIVVALVIVAVSGFRGADYPAHLLRAELWQQSGPSVWNMHWYGGHPTPTYSVLAPPLVALAGPLVVIAVGMLVATYCFARLSSSLLSSAASTCASSTFALCCIPVAVIGRVPFALGTGLALAAAWMWHCGHVPLSCGLAVVTALVSPVAGLFLAVAALAVVVDRAIDLAQRAPVGSRGIRSACAVAIAATGPLFVLSATFGTVGLFPFRGEQLIISILVTASVPLLVRNRVVLVAAVLTIVTSIGLFVVPNPIGGNYVRLAQQIGVPLAAGGYATIDRRAARLVTIPLLVGIGWAIQPGAVAVVQAVGDESASATYHLPLIAEVQRRNGDGLPVGRLEIPFTTNHWESLYVAPEVPYARGWERQVDLARNEVLYNLDLTLTEYRTWLHHNAVRWIALADVDIDEGGRAERELLRLEQRGLDVPWLSLVWSNENWELYEVAGYTPIVDLPARLVHQAPDELVVHVDSPATVTVRYTYSGEFAIEGPSCVARGRDGWTTARLTSAGVHRISVDAGETLDLEAADRCPRPVARTRWPTG